jgi:hypothetical protein
LSPRPARARPREVFVSHWSGDRRFVDSLCAELDRHGVKFWYSKRHIAGARRWHDEIGEALARCDWFVAVLSPQSVKSKWVKHELLYALDDERYERRIVPCQYKKCDPKPLSWMLPSFQSVDFTRGIDAGMTALLALWGLKYRPAQTTRPPAKRRRRRRSKGK